MLFDKTLQKTDEWLRELMEKMDWEDKQMAYDGLRAVLHALRDRLPVEAVVKFGAQLPMLVRGFYYENWVPATTPIKVHTELEFIELARSYLRRTKIKEENIKLLVQNVFQLIERHMSTSETEKLRAILPKPIASLFEKQVSV
jgi:uncharacterized protein (DUF2267 family)